MLERKWFKLLIFTWIFFGTMYFGIFSKIEGSIWSVTDNFQITKVEKVKGGIEIYGTFFKRRNCDFDVLHAYITNENGFYSRIEIIQYDRGTIREIGPQIFGPWFLQSSVDDFRNVTIYSHHTCHQLWQTTSRVMPQ